jgi:hypothetical protein
MARNIKEIISKMTLEEKASLCSGLDFWHTKGIERLGIPSIMMTDGPHGLRKQEQSADHLGIHQSVPATCFPSGAAMACSWDRKLIERVGVALGGGMPGRRGIHPSGAGCQHQTIPPYVEGPLNTFPKIPICHRRWPPITSRESRARE